MDQNLKKKYLSRNSALYPAALNSLSIPICIADQENIIVFCNSAFQRLIDHYKSLLAKGSDAERLWSEQHLFDLLTAHLDKPPTSLANALKPTFLKVRAGHTKHEMRVCILRLFDEAGTACGAIIEFQADGSP